MAGNQVEFTGFEQENFDLLHNFFENEISNNRSFHLDDTALELLGDITNNNWVDDIVTSFNSSDEDSPNLFSPSNESPSSSPTFEENLSSDLSPNLKMDTDMPEAIPELSFDVDALLNFPDPSVFENSSLSGPGESVISEQSPLRGKETAQSCLEPKSEKVKNKKRKQPSSNTTSSFRERSREELLKFNSKQIEEYIQKLSNHRHVPTPEEKDLKKIRRLIKNREYAQSSRTKKKQHVDELETEIQTLRKEKQAMETKIKTLEVENKSLKYQLAQIGSVMKSDPEVMRRIKEASQNKIGSSPPTKKPKVMTFFVLFFFLALFLQVPLLSFNKTPTEITRFTQTGPSTGRNILQTDTNTMEDWELSNLIQKYIPGFIQDFVEDFTKSPSQEYGIEMPHGCMCLSEIEESHNESDPLDSRFQGSKKCICRSSS